MKAVILAGGRGSRLWPISTAAYPKQFHALVSERTLLQETWDRLDFLSPADIFVATNNEYLPLIKDQLPNLPVENIISEPALRDTATCLGYAATRIAHRFGPQTVMSVIYADHLIQDKTEFQTKLGVAAQIAQEDRKIAIIEVKAKFPNTGLGYVKIADLEKTLNDVQIYKFAGFTEKPDAATARKFINSFNYLWNTGFFVWRIDMIMEAFAHHAPETFKHLQAIQSGLGGESEAAVIAEHYPACPKISFDYAIMEKIDPEEVRIIPADLGWSDIGTWESLYKELSGDSRRNIVKGEVTALQSEKCLIYNYQNGKRICLLDLDNLAVINTENALLICPLSSSGKVKDVLAAIETDSNQ